MGPVVITLLALGLGVAGVSWTVSRPIPCAFANYNLASAVICVVLDHAVGADQWIDPFSFLDVFAFSTALLVAMDRTRRWALLLALGYGLQIVLHIARAGEFIPEHGVYRPGLNVGWGIQEAAILWGLYLAPLRPRGLPV